MSGRAVDDVLDALVRANGGRLRGIRVSAAWDADPNINPGGRPHAPPGLLSEANFRAGFHRLVARGLSYDAWQHHPQRPDLCSLANAFPGVSIVVNHYGEPLGVGVPARPDTFARRKGLVAEVACRAEHGDEARPHRTTALRLPVRGPTELSQRAGVGRGLATLHRNLHRRIRTRAMPVREQLLGDEAAGSYRTIWNAFQLATSRCTDAKRSGLYFGTARRVYQIA